MSTMLIALAAMFMQQTFASVGKTLPAVVAPLVIAELHADPAWVGVYYGVAAAAALLAQMGCGSFIIRYGALRMSQVALVLLGGGMAAAARGWAVLGFAASAIIGGGGGAVSTPTSSQLLGRVSPPRLAPLVFSIKQTAVPAGILICGFLGPAMAHAIGWRGAMLATGVACLAAADSCSHCGARFDDDRVPSRRFRLSDFPRDHRVGAEDPRPPNAVLRLLRVQRHPVGIHRLLRHLPGRARLRAGGGGLSVFARRRPRRAVPRAVGVARQFSCFAAPRDGWSLDRDGGRHRDAWNVESGMVRRSWWPWLVPC